MKYIYIENEEFRGSIRGVARFIRKGDFLNPEDVAYFKHHYPNSIVPVSTEVESKSQPELDEKVLGILNEYSKKIDELLEVTKSITSVKEIIVTQPIVETKQIISPIQIEEKSLVSHVKINTQSIEAEGLAGEKRSEGSSVSDKIKLLRQKLQK